MQNDQKSAPSEFTHIWIKEHLRSFFTINFIQRMTCSRTLGGRRSEGLFESAIRSESFSKTGNRRKTAIPFGCSFSLSDWFLHLTDWLVSPQNMIGPINNDTNEIFPVQSRPKATVIFQSGMGALMPGRLSRTTMRSFAHRLFTLPLRDTWQFSVLELRTTIIQIPPKCSERHSGSILSIDALVPQCLVSEIWRRWTHLIPDQFSQLCPALHSSLCQWCLLNSVFGWVSLISRLAICFDEVFGLDGTLSNQNHTPNCPIILASDEIFMAGIICSLLTEAIWRLIALKTDPVFDADLMNGAVWIPGSRHLSCPFPKHFRLDAPWSCLSSKLLERYNWTSLDTG
jgi:hypothetical protein